MLAITIFLVTKFLIYSVYCIFAPRWLDFHEYHPVRFGLIRGAIRMLVGFMGMWVILGVAMNMENVGIPYWSAYLLSFAPVRVLEWLALYLLIALPKELPFRARSISWIAGGVLVSFLCDGMGFVLVDSKLMDFKINC